MTTVSLAVVYEADWDVEFWFIVTSAVLGKINGVMYHKYVPAEWL